MTTIQKNDISCYCPDPEWKAIRKVIETDADKFTIKFSTDIQKVESEVVKLCKEKFKLDPFSLRQLVGKVNTIFHYIYVAFTIDVITENPNRDWIDVLEKQLKKNDIIGYVRPPVFWSNQSLLDYTNIDWFLKTLYHPFLALFADESYAFIKNDWPLGKFKTYLPCDVQVELSFDNIKTNFQKYRMLQLREIDQDAEVLIIGCGNGRLSDMGGYPNKDDKEYALDHIHYGEVTLSPDLTDNPTIIAFFNDQIISPIFKGKKFKKIIFEGYFPGSGTNPENCQDLLKLLDTKGDIYINDENISERLEKYVKDWKVVYI